MYDRAILLPMTAEVRAIVRSALLSGWRPYAVMLFALLIVALVGATAVGGRQLDPSDLPRVIALLFGPAVALIGLVYALDATRLLRDLRDPTFLRSTGTVTADEEWDYAFSYKLSVNGIRLRSPWRRQGEAPFSTLPGGTVDHTKHAHVVLAIRDANGRAIYLMDGYRG